jgi:hypothetical protein
MVDVAFFTTGASSPPLAKITSGLRRDQLVGCRRKSLRLSLCIPVLDCDILSINVAKRFQPLQHRDDGALFFLRIQQDSDPSCPRSLLRKRGQRPRSRAAEYGDEFAAPHGLPSVRLTAAHYHTLRRYECASQEIRSSSNGRNGQTR